MKFNRLILATLATAVSLSAFAPTSAGAVTLRKCPDGTVVADSESCPKGKTPHGPKTGPMQFGATTLAAPSGANTHGNPAPKPDDSTEKWRDYINGNKKPPIRPKG
ncbi:hypothetical protein [Nitratireductor luteus]|uniref:hypothetical protein n=1 Tax=Nitratireductor luteus TaxID=2976980 RepID=UPI00223F4546|nr:hypothetical protein [Nitratireductor luteus]